MNEVRIIYVNTYEKKLHMELKTWKNAHDGKILKSDTTVAKK